MLRESLNCTFKLMVIASMSSQHENIHQRERFLTLKKIIEKMSRDAFI